MSNNKITDALDTVEISKKVYLELVQDQAILNALFAAGVDNWEGYGIAIESMVEELDD